MNGEAKGTMSMMNNANTPMMTGANEAFDYRARADRHRPQDPEAIERTCRCLALQGLRDRDIAEVLRVPLSTVQVALNRPENAFNGNAGDGQAASQ